MTTTAPQVAHNPSGTSGAASQPSSTTALPFVASARKHRESFPIVNNTFTMEAVSLQNLAIPSYGFLRGILLRVTATGGAGTSVAGVADAPFNVLGPISITDPDSAPIYNAVGGYDAYLIQKYGGYKYQSDPKLDPFYSDVASASGNFSFQLYIPLEIISRNGLGSLANTDSGKEYNLNLSFNPPSVVYSTLPTTTPTVTVSAWAICWTQPTPVNMLGQPQTQTPPLMGTTQYWSRQTIPVNAGYVDGQRFGRVGNIIRGWIFTARTTAGLRSDTMFPPTTTLYRDGYNYDIIDQNVWQTDIEQTYGYDAAPESPGGRDVGVYPYMFIDDLTGGAGDELRQQYWPTAQSSRIELQGTFGSAGNLVVITNDISPNGDISSRIVL